MGVTKEGGGDARTIFLVEEDDQTRALLAQNLRGYGYRVVAALDEEDALGRVSGLGARADLILIDLVGKSVEEELALGRRVREHARYDGHTPLVVMPEKYGKDVEGTEVNVGGNDWVFYLGEEPGQLMDFLARLLA
jgi:PleD family two-component response regulator